MRRMIKLFLQLFIVVSFVNVVQCQHFVKLTDASGINKGGIPPSIVDATSKLIQSLPIQLRDSFKVFDGGFYVLNESSVHYFNPNFESLIAEASSSSKYFLLFGRQIDRHNICTKIWMELRLEGNSGLSCLKKANVDALNKAVERYSSSNLSNLIADHSDYYNVEAKAIEFLEGELKQYTSCCTGISISNCFCGKNGKEKIEDLLKLYGYIEWSNQMELISISPRNIPHHPRITGNWDIGFQISHDLQDETVTQVVNYTEELKEFLNLSLSSKARISYFDTSSCHLFADFEPMALEGEFAEDIVILYFNGEYKLFNKFKFSQNEIALRNINESREVKFVPTIILWGIRKLTVAAMEVLVDGLLEYAIVHGFNSNDFFSASECERTLGIWWKEYSIWDAISTFGYSLISPEVAKKFKLILTFGFPVVKNVTSYFLKRPDWKAPIDWTRVAAEAFRGLVQGFTHILLQNLGDKVVLKIRNMDYATLFNALEKNGLGVHFFKIRTFRILIAKNCWTFLGGAGRGIIWERILKVFKYTEPQYEVMGKSWSADFIENLGGGLKKAINVKTIDTKFGKQLNKLDNHIADAIRQSFQAINGINMKDKLKAYDFKIEFWVDVDPKIAEKKVLEYLKKWYGTGGDFDNHIDEIIKIKKLGGIEDLIKKFEIINCFSQ